MGNSTVPLEHITQSIVVVRGQKVLLDSALAGLYGVGSKRLNERVKRNFARFPKDFLFRLTPDEIETLKRSRFATGSQKHRDPRFPPYAFTEHGAIMAATAQLESKLETHDEAILEILAAIRELMSPPQSERRCIGFTADLA